MFFIRFGEFWANISPNTLSVSFCLSFPFGTPIIYTLIFLMVSHRFLKLSSFFFFKKYVPLCYGLNACVSPKPIYEILIFSGIVLGGGVFGSDLGHNGGALMSGISALMKDTPQVLSTL